MTEPVFTNVLQVGIVVNDCDEAVKRYWHQYGIGPWAIYNFSPETVQEMVLHGKPVEYSMRLAVALVGGVELKLIEPKDDKSDYARFLREHGEGLHHLYLDTAQGYHKTIEFFEKKGMGVLQGGLWQTSRYAYINTLKDLGFITEIDEAPDAVYPKPDAVYPPDATLPGNRYGG